MQEKKVVDVSLELGCIRDKLNFMGLCMSSYDAMDGIPEEALSGAGGILQSLADEVEKVSQTLYPETKDPEGGAV